MVCICHGLSDGREIMGWGIFAPDCLVLLGVDIGGRVGDVRDCVGMLIVARCDVGEGTAVSLGPSSVHVVGRGAIVS
jgi:hypothetical protein